MGRIFGSLTGRSLPANSFRRRLNGCLLHGCLVPIAWVILTIVIDTRFFPLEPKWN